MYEEFNRTEEIDAYFDKIEAETVQVETEFMISWVKENPNLFSDKFNNFFVEYPISDWEHRSDARKGYITLIAIKKSLDR